MRIPAKGCLVFCVLLASAQSLALSSTALSVTVLNSPAADADTVSSITTEAWRFHSESEVLKQLPKLEQQAITTNKLLLVS